MIEYIDINMAKSPTRLKLASLYHMGFISGDKRQKNLAGIGVVFRIAVMLSQSGVVNSFRLENYGPGWIRDNNPYLTVFLLLCRLNLLCKGYPQVWQPYPLHPYSLGALRSGEIYSTNLLLNRYPFFFASRFVVFFSFYIPEVR